MHSNYNAKCSPNGGYYNQIQTTGDDFFYDDDKAPIYIKTKASSPFNAVQDSYAGKIERMSTREFLAEAQSTIVPFSIYIHDPNEDHFVSMEIAKTGTWHLNVCKNLRTIAMQLAQHQKKVTFLDIGANIGYVSMWMAASTEKINVIAVEPHPYHNQLFEKSLKLPINSEISNRIKLHKYYIGPTDHVENIKCIRSKPDQACMYAPIRTLGQVCTLEESSSVVDIIKIDLKGCKLDALLENLTSKMEFSPKVIVLDYDSKTFSSVSNGEISMAQVMERMFVEFGYSSIIDQTTKISLTSLEKLKEYFSQDMFSTKPKTWYQTSFLLKNERFDVLGVMV